MKIANSKNYLQENKNNIHFKGPLDGLITQSLITIDTSPMINAALVDIFAMVIPRTYVDTKERNKYAGGETLFRELTGTVIVCLSSGFIAKGISRIYNKFVKPEIKLNPDSWVTNDSLELLKHSWNKSGNNVEKYVSNVLTNSSGVDGKNTSAWKDIDWKQVNWLDNPNWTKIKWKDSKYQNIQNDLKSESQITKTLSQIITDNNIDKNDAKNILGIIDNRITNALNVSNSVDVKIDDKTLNASLTNIIRDVHDLGKNVFTNKSINVDAALNKLQKMNKTKTLGALAIASGLGLTNQYINRIITKKRTGTDEFVGEVDYKKFKGKQVKKQPPTAKEKRELLGWKVFTSLGIVALAAGVMKIRNPKDFVKKLEFTGPVTSGNAIKTVYTATLVGRFIASKNKNELRESATRDYLGFLNWLVLGGFAAKGVANLLDRKREVLFNVHKEGKGLKHWLNNLSVKSHAEVASKGSKFAKKNIWKINAAHIGGLMYSTVALGFLIPLLNIAITKNRHKKAQNLAAQNSQN